MPYNAELGPTRYAAAVDRYEQIAYRRCGRSGLKLPAISLGLWQNFGDDRPLENSRRMLRRAFDLGITHFDLANNYGPPYGSAESNFGRILDEDLRPYRDELVISTKAGYDMWPGPYGEFGSRKYLLSSLDQSLQRLRLDHVDIFYSHRFDPETPLEETMGALDTAVRAGKARYVGVSSYGPEMTERAADILRDARDTVADPPAVLLDAQPLDRARPARRAGPQRDRRDHLLAARPRPVDRPLSAGHRGGLPRAPRTLLLRGVRQPPEPRARARAQRDRPSDGGRRSRSWRSPGRCAIPG